MYTRLCPTATGTDEWEGRRRTYREFLCHRGRGFVCARWPPILSSPFFQSAEFQRLRRLTGKRGLSQQPTSKRAGWDVPPATAAFHQASTIRLGRGLFPIQATAPAPVPAPTPAPAPAPAPASVSCSGPVDGVLYVGCSESEHSSDWQGKMADKRPFRNFSLRALRARVVLGPDRPLIIARTGTRLAGQSGFSSSQDRPSLTAGLPSAL